MEEEELLRHKRDGNADDSDMGRGVEGKMEGEVEGEEVEEVCWAVLVIVISIIHSNNTYFTAVPLLE